MNATALRQNMKIKEKNMDLNVVLIIKYSSTVMQNKRKLCEYHTKFFKIMKTFKFTNSDFHRMKL